MRSINSFISKMPSGFGDENGRYTACSIGLFEEVALEAPSLLCCIALWDGFFFLSFFGLFATLRLRGRPGRDGCPSAMWDCFKG